MGFIRSIKDTLNTIVDNYRIKHPLPEKDVDFRYAPAPAEMGNGWREIQKYNTLTGETITTPRKVYALVWTEEMIEKLQEIQRQIIEKDTNYKK